MKLTQRLQAIADLVQRQQGIIADVGTDHGLIPIALATRFANRKIYALDVRPGPLEKAKKNAAAHQLQERIEFKLSDGLQACLTEPIQTVIIAGMGGHLIERILSQGRDCLVNDTELILSPHSDLYFVRKVIHQLGFQIAAERYVKEANKIYPIIYAIFGPDISYSESEYWFGRMDKTVDKELLTEMRQTELNEMNNIYLHLNELAADRVTINRKKQELAIKIKELTELMSRIYD